MGEIPQTPAGPTEICVSRPEARRFIIKNNPNPHLKIKKKGWVQLQSLSYLKDPLKLCYTLYDKFPLTFYQCNVDHVFKTQENDKMFLSQSTM